MYIDNVKRGNMLKVDWICCIQYRHSVMNHCDRHVTLFSDTDIHCISKYLLVCLICLHILISNTLNVKVIFKIYLIEQKIYPNHQV